MNTINLQSNFFVTSEDLFADVTVEDFVDLMAETYTKSIDFMRNRVQICLEERLRADISDKIIRSIYNKITSDEKFRNRTGILCLIKRYKNR